MKATIITEDKRMIWTDVPDPILSDGEVLVEVHAAGLNRADVLQVAGLYPPPPGIPEWPGLELSGVIAEINGDCGNWKVGDEICALLSGGAYAQYAKIHHTMLMPIPKGFSVVEAASLPEAYATAYLNLFIEGGAKSGQTFLMNAGASGLASVIIPMAKAFGLRVITTVLSAEIAESIKHLKADIVVDTSTQNIADVLKEQEALGHPLNLAIDCLGGEKVGECFPYVAYGCRWIIIATLAGQQTPTDLANLLTRNIRLIGSTLRSKSDEVKAHILSSLVKELWPKVESGEVLPTIWKIMPIIEVEKAHEMMINGETVGKILLTVK